MSLRHTVSILPRARGRVGLQKCRREAKCGLALFSGTTPPRRGWGGLATEEGQAVRDSFGRVQLRSRKPPWKPQKPGQWLKSRGDWIVYLVGARYVSAVWKPWKGLLAVGSGLQGSRFLDRVYCDHFEVMPMIKRRDVSTSAGYVVPPLSADSKLLAKCPALLEFLTATQYEDGSPRTPGYMWISNRTAAFEVTVFDPDGCGKLPVLAKTLDEAFALVEVHLRADQAPWQQDGFLLKKASEKKKR